MSPVIMGMVDLTGIFWNQVYEQLTAWHKKFSGSNPLRLFVATKLLRNSNWLILFESNKNLKFCCTVLHYLFMQYCLHKP